VLPEITSALPSARRVPTACKHGRLRGPCISPGIVDTGLFDTNPHLPCARQQRAGCHPAESNVQSRRDLRRPRSPVTPRVVSACLRWNGPLCCWVRVLDVGISEVLVHRGLRFGLEEATPTPVEDLAGRQQGWHEQGHLGARIGLPIFRTPRASHPSLPE